MKYIRYELEDENYVGILDDDIIHRLNYSSILSAVESEENLEYACVDDKITDVNILPPTNPSKIVCIGLNYKDHAEEFNMELPQEPLLFIKPSTSIIGCYDNILYPDSSNKLDFEGELGIVILDKIDKNTLDIHIGYTIINDVTARDLQQKDGQWTRSKSFDTFCPCGPVVSTNINPSNLHIQSKVNEQIKQDSNTKNMIFSPIELVKYISNIMTLNPGDLIATGTPPGVDHLQKNDVVTITIEEIGSLINIIK